jgi:hypothetical protein
MLSHCNKVRNCPVILLKTKKKGRLQIKAAGLNEINVLHHGTSIYMMSHF